MRAWSLLVLLAACRPPLSDYPHSTETYHGVEIVHLHSSADYGADEVVWIYDRVREALGVPDMGPILFVYAPTGDYEDFCAADSNGCFYPGGWGLSPGGEIYVRTHGKPHPPYGVIVHEFVHAALHAWGDSDGGHITEHWRDDGAVPMVTREAREFFERGS